MSDPQVTTLTFGPKHERGVCSVCGKLAYDGRATKCEEHRTGSKTARKATPAKDATTTIRPDEIADATAGQRTVRVETPKGSPPSKADKSDRAKELKRLIVNDANPELIKGFAFLCRPISSDNFYVIKEGSSDVVPTDIGNAVAFSDLEATVLSKAIAELEKSPLVGAASAIAGPVVPVALAVGAIGVLLFHGYNVMTLRAQLLTQYAAMQQATAPQEAGPVTPEPTPEPMDMQPQTNGHNVVRPLFTEQSLT